MRHSIKLLGKLIGAAAAMAVAGTIGCATSADLSSAATLKYYEGGQEIDAELLIEKIPPRIRTQWMERVNRLRTLATKRATSTPSFQESIVVRTGEVSGISHPIPVLRIAFAEQSFFDFDRNELKTDAAPIVELIAELIRLDGEAYTLVVGHTDAIGLDEYNDQLANRRATTVVQLLVKMGIGRDHLHTAAMGRRQAIAPNATLEGRARNRRVEFLISQSYQANLNALTQLPVRPEFGATSDASEPKKPPPSENVDIHDVEGKKTGGVTVRPAIYHTLRKF